MQLTVSVFHILHANSFYEVRFYTSNVEVVDLQDDGTERKLATFEVNDWKPCKTHAFEILSIAIGSERATPWATRRRKAAKPSLKIYDDVRPNN